MATFIATRASAESFELGEGIIYDSRVGRLRWVDILQGTLHSGFLVDHHVVDVDSVVLGQTIGAVAAAGDGGLLVAAGRGLATVSPEMEVSFGPDLLSKKARSRLNDGAVDPQGRFVVGSVALGSEAGGEVLLRVSPDGAVETLREGIRLSNGIAFSPDGTVLYHVDTLARTVSWHSYGPGAFDREEESWSTIIRDIPHLPDGLTVDAEGGLWVALWGGSRVLHYDSAGNLRDEILVGAAQVSCPAFVGPALDVLAITTAREGVGSHTEAAGSIFVADVGVRGISAPMWAGDTRRPSWV